VLIGGAFEWLFAPRGENLNKPIFKSSNTQGLSGGDVELWNGSARYLHVRRVTHVLEWKNIKLKNFIPKNGELNRINHCKNLVPAYHIFLI